MTQLTLEQRRQELLTYQAYYDLHYFIESGTNEGDTVAAMLPYFDDLWTIEIDPDLWARAQQRFVGDLNVSCIHGNSGSILPNILRALKGPALIWLDGHYCGGPFKPEIDTPIVDEVNHILAAPKGSVVLIDDARLFGGGEEHTEEFKDYPPLAWIENMAELGGYHYELRDDVIRLVPT